MGHGCAWLAEEEILAERFRYDEILGDPDTPPTSRPHYSYADRARVASTAFGKPLMRVSHFARVRNTSSTVACVENHSIPREPSCSNKHSTVRDRAATLSSKATNSTDRHSPPGHHCGQELAEYERLSRESRQFTGDAGMDAYLRVDASNLRVIKAVMIGPRDTP
jgi:hypothetical protein